MKKPTNKAERDALIKKLQAIISVSRQTGFDEWNTYHHSKTFEKTATIQEIEDWAKTYGKGITIFDVKLSTKD